MSVLVGNLIEICGRGGMDEEREISMLKQYLLLTLLCCLLPGDGQKKIVKAPRLQPLLI